MRRCGWCGGARRAAAVPETTVLRVGVISDTHGLLRPEALEFLAGCDHLLHAGDVGNAAVLEALGRLAPLIAVRGNNDHGDWARALPEVATPRFGGIALHLTHEWSMREAPPPGARVVVAGHSHQPRLEEREGVLFLNPGSAGPRRFRLPVSLGELRIEGGEVQARLLTLQEGSWR